MKIEIAKSDLMAALQVTSIGMGSGNASELSSHYVFRAKDSAAEVLTYNHSTYAGCPLTGASVEGKGTFTVEGSRFLEWVKATRDEVLTLTYDSKSGSVEASTDWGSIRFSSLDPSKFPFWDKDLEEATSRGKVSALRLHAVFSYLHPFILNRDTTHPDKSLTEIREGNFLATDLTAVTVVQLNDGDDTILTDSTLRIHVGDVPKLVSFLGQTGESEVEILEHSDKNAMFRLPDGSLFGTARPKSSWPPIVVSPDDESPMSWTVTTEDLVRAINWLKSGASKDKKSKDATMIQFAWVDDKVKMSMKRYQGGGENTLSIDATDTENLDGLPTEGFKLPYSYLMQLVKLYKSPTLTFGITSKGPSKGWCRFSRQVDGDKFATMVAWQ